MQRPDRYTAVRYLTAKAPVDERSLNPRVFDALAQGISELGDNPLRIIELGAGVGSTFRRLHNRGLFTRGEYVMVDLDEESLTEASRTAEELLQDVGGAERDIRAVSADAIAYLRQETEEKRGIDVIIAQALVDLLNVPQFVHAVFNALRPGGLCYLPITFDGITVFEPALDENLDARIVEAYHRTMDERRTPDGLVTGGRAAGRALLAELPRAGLEIIEAGASDWIVFPQNGDYASDIAYFLHHIINFVWESLNADTELMDAGLREWIDERHAQIERGELIYMAHQLDVLARKPH